MFTISELPAAGGTLGISPIPGRTGNYEADLTSLIQWGPSLVLTMTIEAELERSGAAGFPTDLKALGILWRHLPISDFGAPSATTEALWPETSKLAHRHLATGGKVLAHCYGGCGRSGMVILRLLVETGENAVDALARLRAVRPCAVETDAQFEWAAGG